MKKLMIMAAVAMAAMMSQAVAVKWTTDVLKAPGATGAFTEDQLSKGTYSNLKVVLTFFESDGLGGWKEITTIPETGTTATKFAKSGAVTATTSVFDFLKDTDYQYSAHYEVTYGGKDWTMDVENQSFKHDLTTGTYALSVANAGAWTTAAVPEPTSGLLLLLGVAGLALRRRRA